MIPQEIYPANMKYCHAGFRGRIGVARSDITPPEGIYARNWGAARHDTASGVHLPLTATALSLQEDSAAAPLVLVALDLGWWRSSHDEQRLRHAVLQALSLGEERLMLQFSHTHAGPALCREDTDRPGGGLIAPYLEGLAAIIITLVNRAVATAAPATLDWSYGSCSLAANRDLPDPEQDRFLSGFNPSAAADDTLLVGRVTDSDGRCAAVLVNYACHPTTLAWENRRISPDFVGAMRDVVEGAVGGYCLYLQGASGELAPREQYTADTSVADRHGRQLGYAALSTLTGMGRPGTALSYSGAVESGASLAWWRRVDAPLSTTAVAQQVGVELALKSMPSVRELDSQISQCTDRVLLERLYRKRRIRQGVGEGTTSAAPVWIWRIGDAILVGHPNEAYSNLQTELRSRFPSTTIAVMNVVNGHFGYLPPVHLYSEDLYPVWQTPYAAGGLETLIDACADGILRIAVQPEP